MNILIIAYGFPPASSSSTFRPLYFARHLEEMGENVSVLTAREQDYLPEQPKDYKLLEQIPDHVEIFRTRVFRPREAILHVRDILVGKKADTPNGVRISYQHGGKVNLSKSSLIQELKDIITESFAIPDRQAGWLPLAVKTGLNIIKSRKIDVMYATGGPWTSLLIGGVLRKFTKTPLVMDFRDPWVANPYFLVRSRFIRAIESSMERRVLTLADHIVTNTDELKQNFLNRYPMLNAQKVTTIPNGFEEYLDSPEDQGKRFTLTHAGALYFSRNPRSLLQAVIHVLENNLIPKNDLRLVFLGGISIPDPELEQFINHPVLQDVIELLPRLPYHEAIRYQNKSHVLFLIQPDFPLQVPRKLYEYIAFRKPILGITNAEGATARVIRENHLGIVVENRTEDIETALKDLYEQWKDGRLDTLDGKACDEFLNKDLTLRLHRIFRECL